MLKRAHRWLIGVVASLGFFVFGSSGAAAQVVVFDQAGMVGVPVNVAVRTAGLFSAAGGRLVDLELAGEPLGRLMTGADGFGYRRFTPAQAGLLNLEAIAEGHRASGRLLVLNPTEQAVLIEVETALKAMIWGADGREDCRSALESIGRRYRLIYISRWLGADFVRARIAPAGLPETVVLPWKGVATLKSLQHQGVPIAALVGSEPAVSEARSRIEQRFTFEKTRDAILVSRGAEISDRLNSPASH